MTGKPLPLKMKILRGTDRSNRRAGGKLTAHTGPVKMPKGLPKEAQKLWKSLAPQLIEAGLLTPFDVQSFALLCMNWSVALEAGQKLETEGLTRKDESGINRKSIYLQILRDATASFKILAGEFGLTPAGRSRLAVQPQQERETLAEKLGKVVSE